MKYNPKKHRRKPTRLRGYDYSQPGMYFVTLCVHGRECLLGNVLDGEMVLSDIGMIAHQAWLWLQERFHLITVDPFCIMPNHTHAIIQIHDTRCSGGLQTATTKPVESKTLGRLVGAYKTHSTVAINQNRNTVRALFWQRSFYDHIICNDGELQSIQEYIFNNALKWEMDQDNPLHWK
jgi:REP element-mobilizing transposase RayT